MAGLRFVSNRLAIRQALGQIEKNQDYVIWSHVAYH